MKQTFAIKPLLQFASLRDWFTAITITQILKTIYYMNKQSLTLTFVGGAFAVKAQISRNFKTNVNQC